MYVYIEDRGKILMSVIGMWFRKDLRLTDNTALIAALKEAQLKNDKLVGIFHLNPLQFKVTSFNHDYFFTAVAHFVEVAKAAGLPIHFLYGEIEAAFEELTQKIPTLNQIYFNRDERGFGAERDRKMESFFAEKGIECHHFQDSHLHGATENRKQDQTAFKVFTPYYKSWEKLRKPNFQKIDSQKLKEFALDKQELFSEGQAGFTQLMQSVDEKWASEVGALKARKRLRQFISSGIEQYDQTRDFPAQKGTSRLSQFLRTGELSIREVYHRIKAEAPDSIGKETYLKELCWRDFYNMIYFENPQQQVLEIKEQYRNLQWNNDEQLLQAWKTGQTGYPLVDAAMRQLNQTGWMHNRLRMIAASFLVKDLLMDWRLGEAYFAEKLIDYDAASNIGGWQWAASTGTDAVPYFRIFNPTTQSQRFDEAGDFIYKYVPELKGIPHAYLHEPSKMPLNIQQEKQIIIGEDYPQPIVQHKLMRQKALELFKGIDQ